MSTLESAATRQCFWYNDYAYCSFLKPAVGQPLNVSQAMQWASEDASPANNQSVPANATSVISFNANTINPNAFPVPPDNTAVMFESLRFGIRCRDNSAKLQIASAVISLGDGFTLVPTQTAMSIPYTFPAGSGIAIHMIAILPVPLLFPRPAGTPFPANGPNVTFTIVNSDGAGTHVYTRISAGTYRYIYNVDFTTGPAMGGAGISGEFSR